jgi:hypothetical protein
MFKAVMAHIDAHLFNSVCNAESVIPLSAVTARLNSLLHEFEQVHAAFSSRPKKWFAERAEIAASKVVLLKSLRDSLLPLAVDPADLMGGKPSSSLSRFPGTAEEQPGPREESRQPIGQNPVTVAGAAPSSLPSIDESAGDFWIETAHSDDLRALSEAVLDELDQRGEAATWTAI